MKIVSTQSLIFYSYISISHVVHSHRQLYSFRRVWTVYVNALGLSLFSISITWQVRLQWHKWSVNPNRVVCELWHSTGVVWQLPHLSWFGTRAYNRVVYFKYKAKQFMFQMLITFAIRPHWVRYWLIFTVKSRCVSIKPSQYLHTRMSL